MCRTDIYIYIYTMQREREEEGEIDEDSDAARVEGCESREMHGGLSISRGLSHAWRTHIVRFYTRSVVEMLRSSDQIGSTKRVRSIGLTATAQIHGRPRNIPWPQSRLAIHSCSSYLVHLIPVSFCRNADRCIVARRDSA